MANLITLINDLSSSFSIAESLTILNPLLLFIGGVVVYCLFVFKFYKFIAAKDIFILNLARYNKVNHEALKKTLRLLLYILEYLIVFPIFVFFWFIVFAILLSFLTKSQSIQTILLISMTLVASIRATSYYSEELSRDVAKMLPFALLGIFLIDISFFSIDSSLNLVKQIPSTWVIMIYYLIFVIFLEFVLRILSSIILSIKGNGKEVEEVVEEVNEEVTE